MVLLTANDLRPGVRFTYAGHPVEILRDRERRPDRFGMDLDSWWSRRLDTGDEGYVSLGPGGVLRVEPLKTPPAQLDREIAEVLASPRVQEASPKRSSRASTTKSGHGHGMTITEQQALELPRFEFIAHWLAVVTRRKADRALAGGKRVKYVGGRWQVVSPIQNVVEYETPDADRLYDYARRGPLGWHIRNAESFRAEAHQRARR